MSGKRQAEPLKLHVTYKAALRDVFFLGGGRGPRPQKKV